MSFSSGCHDNTWVKARLCWTLSDDVISSVSHYLVWTNCSIDNVRTVSSANASICHQSYAAISETISDVDQTSGAMVIDDDDKVNVSKPYATEMSRIDLCPVASSSDSSQLVMSESPMTVEPHRRCLGLTPVTSLTIECKNLLNYHEKFSVQPVLFRGLVLPHINLVVH